MLFAMLNWNSVEQARLHREDLLREAAVESHAEQVNLPRQPLALLLVLLVAAQRWLQAS